MERIAKPLYGLTPVSSKNRHGRFQESKLFEELFEQIVRQCVEVGLVQGKHLSVDGSFVEANASKESRIPREQLAEAAQVNQTARQYVGGTGAAEPHRRARASANQVSTTDPDWIRFPFEKCLKLIHAAVHLF